METKKKNVVLWFIFVLVILGAVVSFGATASGHSPPLYVSFLLVLAALVVLELRTHVYRNLFCRKDCRR